MPPLGEERPAIECPPPRIAIGRSCARAWSTAATTSAVPLARTMRSGVLACIALYAGRDGSGSLGPATGPLICARSSSSAKPALGGAMVSDIGVLLYWGASPGLASGAGAGYGVRECASVPLGACALHAPCDRVPGRGRIGRELAGEVLWLHRSLPSF